MNINETIKPISISGEQKTWERARIITINNDYNKIPKLTFKDERITISPIGIRHEGLPDIDVMFNPEEEFDLIHPETGQVIGRAKYQDLQILLYSLYVAKKS